MIAIYIRFHPIHPFDTNNSFYLSFSWFNFNRGWNLSKNSPILHPIYMVKNFFKGLFLGWCDMLRVILPLVLNFSKWELLGLSTIDWRICNNSIDTLYLHKVIKFRLKSDWWLYCLVLLKILISLYFYYRLK